MKQELRQYVLHHCKHIAFCSIDVIIVQRWSPRGRPWPRGRPRGQILKSLESVCPRKGWPWPRIFLVSLALASSLVSSTPPLLLLTDSDRFDLFFFEIDNLPIPKF